MAHRKHHDIWRGPIIECYGNPAKQPSCRNCAHYATCTRSKRGKSTCSAFSAISKGRKRGQGSCTSSAASSKHKKPLDWVARDLVRRGIYFTDERSQKNGCLWVRAGRTRQMEALMAEYAAHGAMFRFSQEGSAVTNHLPGWYLRGFPVNRGYSEDTAATVRAKLVDNSDDTAIRVGDKPAIKVGDHVRHKEYGEGVVKAVKLYGSSTRLAEVKFNNETQYISPRALASGEIWPVEKPNGKAGKKRKS